MNAQEVISRLCRLQEQVYFRLGNEEMGSADCFCGKGGMWKSEGYGGTFEQGYRNDGKVLEFIEQAVIEKLNRERP